MNPRNKPIDKSLTGVTMSIKIVLAELTCQQQ